MRVQKIVARFFPVDASLSVFTVVAEVHLDTQTAPAGMLCSFHSQHTGTSPGISVLSGRSMLLSR